ncbi:hypothetical protein NicSoilB4_00150 [Arthrobacter sp. NicSoilB4]|nr:hypothetical protein NicSoilB4_00150 [Arthrobacter sp. NicSoilB4]
MLLWETSFDAVFRGARPVCGTPSTQPPGGRDAPAQLIPPPHRRCRGNPPFQAAEIPPRTE